MMNPIPQIGDLWVYKGDSDYFNHPSTYFIVVGKITREGVLDGEPYARIELHVMFSQEGMMSDDQWTTENEMVTRTETWERLNAFHEEI